MKNKKLGTDIRIGDGYFIEGETGIIPTDSGDMSVIDDLENVRQALYMRLSTPIGDHWAHPEYGNRAHDMVGEPMSDDFIVRVTDAFRDCVNAEPRVKLISIVPEPYPENRIIIFNLRYQVLNDPRQDNMVYPFKAGDLIV